MGGPTGAYLLDDPPDLSCKDGTRHYSVDDPLLSCDAVLCRARWLAPVLARAADSLTPSGPGSARPFEEITGVQPA